MLFRPSALPPGAAVDRQRPFHALIHSCIRSFIRVDRRRLSVSLSPLMDGGGRSVVLFRP